MSVAPAAAAAPREDLAGAVLVARSLYRFYRAGDEETLALQGVSLQVCPGEILVIRGPSGSGKSTLMSLLAGLDEPSGGEVVVAGHRMSHRPERERARLRAEHVGVLAQTGNLFDHLTLGQNVALSRRLLGRRNDPAGLQELLGAVRLDGREGAYPAQLSGGELARAGMAVALANAPEVLLADEPTGELDSDTEQRVLETLTARAAQGCAVVLASHSPAVAQRADRVLTLSEGRAA